jgi:imidazolonepropionase-like amidohydrolase
LNGRWTQELLPAVLLGAVLLFAAPAGRAADPASWQAALPEQPHVLLVRNATLWTSARSGTLERTDMLVREGRIAAIGRDLDAPLESLVLDAGGRHVTPGLIDGHSHAMLTGGVNEGSNSVTAEVRIVDAIDPESVNIYRQLAGGVTAANLLHGSANAIGGQNAVIKLRWGATAEGLLFDAARPGIKFALGENPKRSNFERPELRYPQSRPGVEQLIRERLMEARSYAREWSEYRAADDPERVPPRRDLQQEALVEVLEGRRDVHAHSYRADEILMLMRVAEELGFRVTCFQHVLEGYKVADELAAHGAAASTFSDWWAYKYEVIDAIPYNAALMHRRGVSVSLKSDSAELARRLNLEAAMAVRYGGLSHEAALSLVTLQPAVQLGIDDRVGSLEVGKDADFVVWSGSPLSTYSIVEQTWVDGRRYFDRDRDLAGRAAVEAERTALLEKARRKPPEDVAEESSEAEE